jgi:hypothetical protein
MNLDPCPYMRSASFMFLSGFISTGFLSPPSYRSRVRLAPQIFVDAIRQGDAANRPEPTHGVADRQNR